MTTADLQSLSFLQTNMRSAITMAWEHGEPDFQARFDKSTAQAQEMKEGALRVCDGRLTSVFNEDYIYPLDAKHSIAV